MSMLRKGLKSCLSLVFGELNLIELSFKLGRTNKNDFYDKMTILILQRYLRDDSICVDVGCHCGAILKHMVHFASNGTFLAFEPLPDLLANLKATFGRRVRILPYALGDKCGTSSFKFVQTNPGYSGFRERRYDSDNERIVDISVEERTLDSVLESERVDRIDFIKVDVEGAEILVFRGGKRAIESSKPLIVFEHGDASARYCKPQEVYRFFADCGMQVSTLPAFLRKRPSLEEGSFCRQVSSGEYYFVAHPAMQ